MIKNMNFTKKDWEEYKEYVDKVNEERAIEDIWAMEKSPDYGAKEINKAIRKARKHLGMREEEFLPILMFKCP